MTGSNQKIVMEMENSSGPSIEPYVTPFEIRRKLKNDPANRTDGLFSCDISWSHFFLESH